MNATEHTCQQTGETLTCAACGYRSEDELLLEEAEAHIEDCFRESCERQAYDNVKARRRDDRRELAEVRTLIASDLVEELINDYADACRQDRVRRLALVRNGKCLPMYAIAVRTTRHYGGPEEGGWWYDWHQIEEVRRAFTYRQLLAQVRELRSEYPTSRYGRHSMADRTGDVTIYLSRTEEFDRLQSTERPRYE